MLNTKRRTPVVAGVLAVLAAVAAWIAVWSAIHKDRVIVVVPQAALPSTAPPAHPANSYQSPLAPEPFNVPDPLPSAPFYPEPKAESQVPSAEVRADASDYHPERVVMAVEGDTAFSLALEYYGSRKVFRAIIDANPGLNWADRLMGKEVVVLPEHGTSPEPKND